MHFQFDQEPHPHWTPCGVILIFRRAPPATFILESPTGNETQLDWGHSGGVLPYKSHIGMCSSKRYGFGAVSVWKREKLRPFWSRLWTGSLYSLYVHRLITSAERKVKDSRREGMYQSWHFWNKIGHAQSVLFSLPAWQARFYSAIWRSESRDS